MEGKHKHTHTNFKKRKLKTTHKLIHTYTRTHIHGEQDIYKQQGKKKREKQLLYYCYYICVELFFLEREKSE